MHAGALEKYDLSLQKAPQCAAVHCNKAATLAKLDRHSEAIAAAQQALAINKNYAKVSLMIGFGHLMQNLTDVYDPVCCVAGSTKTE